MALEKLKSQKSKVKSWGKKRVGQDVVRQVLYDSKVPAANRQNSSHVVMIISDDQEGAIEISALASNVLSSALLYI